MLPNSNHLSYEQFLYSFTFYKKEEKRGNTTVPPINMLEGGERESIRFGKSKLRPRVTSTKPSGPRSKRVRVAGGISLVVINQY